MYVLISSNSSCQHMTVPCDMYVIVCVYLVLCYKHTAEFISVFSLRQPHTSSFPLLCYANFVHNLELFMQLAFETFSRLLTIPFKFESGIARSV